MKFREKVCLNFCARKSINEMVIAAFNHSISNEYQSHSHSSRSPTVSSDWRHHIIASKFVLCPSGFSFDSFRVWETLLLGSIPVVESNPSGLDRTLSSLPVLVVRNFEDLSPLFMERAYECFVRHAHLFRYEHLQATYWRELVEETATKGNIDRITENHLRRNRYCDFLD